VFVYFVHILWLSTIFGHGSIVDEMARELHHQLESLDRLRLVPFVRDFKYTGLREERDRGYDGKLNITTPHGQFELLVEAKRSYLSRSSVDPLLAWLNHLRMDQKQGVILLARHIPRQAAEALIEANVNFVDDAGNVHLELGDAYNWTAIGSPAPEPASERRPPSPAQLQLLFQFVTYPESVNWQVRPLGLAAGISKSMAAQARRQMITEGLLTRAGKLGPIDLLAERLILGYAQVLRPKLILGRFRPQETTTESFLSRLRKELPVGYALSGGAAADLLQHFYRGPEITFFLPLSNRAITQQLRLLPDREGSVTILRAFSDLVFWEEREHHMLAPPWLIYAELLNSNDPRAQEAAKEFRRKFLA
jgi:hypothetical protein